MARTIQTTRQYTDTYRIGKLEEENVLLNQKIAELTQKFEDSMKFIQTLKTMYEMQHQENVSLASTIIDTLELEEEYTEPEDNESLDLTMENEIEEKKEIMNQTYNDLDLLSDNEELEVSDVEDSELIINENDDEKREEVNSHMPKAPSSTPIQNEAPLPTNLSTSPLPELMNTEEEVNYKKMKVGELKKLCKTKGIKGYSKLKKKQLIELLSQ
jgi:hypothetical protein